MIENEIIQFIHKISNHRIALSVTHARTIVNMVIGSDDKPQTAIVLLHEMDGVSNQYRLLRTIKTTDDIIKAAIVTALEKKPNEGFYRYNCFNSDQEFEGFIYSVNPNIF